MALVVSGPAALRKLSRPLSAIVRWTLASESRTCGEITVVLARDQDLRALNRRWRGIDRATDVLSFSYDGDGAGRRVNGDLVLSLDRLAAQARRFRVSPGTELARLVIHGALHLAGLDHHRAAERRHMRARENAALHACRSTAKDLDLILSVAGARKRRESIASGRRRPIRHVARTTRSR